jgi:hypothetical protein
MAHKLSMGDDGILRMKFSGDFGKEEAEAFLEDFMPFLEAATGTEPMHFIADVSQVGKTSAAARKVFSDLFREPDPRRGKMALVGASRYVRVVAGFLMRAAGETGWRFFDTEEEALAWLKEET